MNAKRFGKSLLFGAAVGATTYLVERIIPRVRETWAMAKDAWAATKEDLEEDYELEAETGDEAEKEPTVAETLGDFLGIAPKKARDLLTSDDDLRDLDGFLVTAIETLNVTAAAAKVVLKDSEDEAQKAVRDGIEVALKRVQSAHEEVRARRQRAAQPD